MIKGNHEKLLDRLLHLISEDNSGSAVDVNDLLESGSIDCDDKEILVLAEKLVEDGYIKQSQLTQTNTLPDGRKEQVSVPSKDLYYKCLSGIMFLDSGGYVEKGKIIRRNRILTCLKILLVSMNAIAVLYLGHKANMLSNRDIEISDSANQPEIKIDVRFTKSNGRPIYTDKVMILRKLSGVMQNIQTSTISFIEVEIYTQSVKHIKRIRTSNTYNANYSSGDSPDIVRQLEGRGTWDQTVKLMKYIELTGKNLGFKFVFTKSYDYLKLHYVDYLNVSRTKYYDISFREGILINDTEEIQNLFIDDLQSFPLISYEDSSRINDVVFHDILNSRRFEKDE